MLVAVAVGWAGAVVAVAAAAAVAAKVGGCWAGGGGATAGEVMEEGVRVGEAVAAVVPVAGAEAAAVGVSVRSGSAAVSSSSRALAAHQLARATTATAPAPMAAYRSHRAPAVEPLSGCFVSMWLAAAKDTRNVARGEADSVPGRSGEGSPPTARVLRPIEEEVVECAPPPSIHARKAHRLGRRMGLPCAGIAREREFFAEMSRYCRVDVTEGIGVAYSA